MQQASQCSGCTGSPRSQWWFMWLQTCTTRGPSPPPEECGWQESALTLSQQLQVHSLIHRVTHLLQSTVEKFNLVFYVSYVTKIRHRWMNTGEWTSGITDPDAKCSSGFGSSARHLRRPESGSVLDCSSISGRPRGGESSTLTSKHWSGT